MPTSPPVYLSLQFFFYKIFLFFQAIGLVGISNDQVIFTGYQYVFYFKLLLVFISAFGTFLITDFLYRLFIVRREEMTWELEQILKGVPSKEKENDRWQTVERLLDSDNESDWKLAIIEADKMLDELLVILGYQGTSLGDRLLAVEKGDMLSLDDAWEAHKYRNKIAHESGFVVTLREARRIVGLYGKVFREYKFI